MSDHCGPDPSEILSGEEAIETQKAVKIAAYVANVVDAQTEVGNEAEMHPPAHSLLIQNLYDTLINDELIK